ncbi:nucleotide exchange factor GrpE [Scatolibacter rhodanostii]|uniref:nucleotide exchange factor GrpE n=1 Tax=Scatolibacter rhodanostii TaxID=2014781 RepID=UPI001FA8FB51|nr:nucleotide exchange factor GrpE [Scatolibacter rhodanostii]
MEQEKEVQSVEETEVTLENNQEAETISEHSKEKGKKKKEKKSPEKVELEKLQADYEVLNDKLLRVCAEYDNFRKRSQTEKLQAYNNALADTVSAILPVYDNVDRALAQEQATAESLLKGLEMIANQFKSSFESLGVKPIGEKGESFDPELHNAVSHIENDELGENVIAEILQKGYILNEDKIIRHAMVQVAN